MKIKKLDVPCTESHTGAKIVIARCDIYEGPTTPMYLVQPTGIKDNGAPVDHEFLPGAVIDGPEVDYPHLDEHLKVLGTELTHIATGTKGYCSGLLISSEGCVHYLFRLKELNKDGSFKEVWNRSHLQFTGPAKKEMSAADVAQEKAEHPSPVETTESAYVA